MSKAPNWNMPNRIALNWTMQSQTKACIVKSSCEISALLGYYSVQWWFLTDISGQPIGTISKGQQIKKREQSTTDVNWHNIFWDFLYCTIF